MSASKLFLALLAALMSLSAAPAHADFKVTSAKFTAERMLKVNVGKYHEMDHGQVSDSFWDAFITPHREIELQGKIVIKEYDRDSISHRVTEIAPVYVVINAYGVNLRAGNIQDVVFPLKGLQGKPISTIFSSPLRGGKISAGLGLVVGVNPNFNYAINEDGVSCVNIERLVRLGDANIGVELAYLTMKFSTESLAKNSKNIEVKASGATVTTGEKSETLTIEALKSRVVGSAD